MHASAVVAVIVDVAVSAAAAAAAVTHLADGSVNKAPNNKNLGRVYVQQLLHVTNRI